LVGVPEERGAMRRFVISMAAASILMLGGAVPANASTRWICNVPGEGDVVFVTAADAAEHGLKTANAHAGQTFANQFGEECRVETGS
jgi:hypothetical protein